MRVLVGLKERGLHGVQFVVSDDHEGLKRAIAEVLPEAVWQRCYVHFLRNALDHLPRKADDDCLTELRWLYDRRDATEARKLHNKVTSIDRTMVDARLVQALHDYVVGSLPLMWKLLGFLIGFRGDKDQG